MFEIRLIVMFKMNSKKRIKNKFLTSLLPTSLFLTPKTELQSTEENEKKNINRKNKDTKIKKKNTDEMIVAILLNSFEASLDETLLTKLFPKPRSLIIRRPKIEVIVSQSPNLSSPT